MSDELVEFLIKLINIPSISSDKSRKSDSLKVNEIIKSFLLDLGFEVKVVPTGSDTNPIILAKYIVGHQRSSYAIYGHYDVQPANKEDGWSTEPFKAEFRDEFVYGRGATDDKGPIVSTLFGLKELIQSEGLKNNIYLIYEGEEESGSGGFEKALKSSQDFFQRIDNIIVIDNYWLSDTRPCLTYGVRGLVYILIEIDGFIQDLHSGIHGGAVREPMTDLINILSQLINTKGESIVPGIYDEVRELSEAELKLYENVEFDITTYKKMLGVSKLPTEDVKQHLIKRWREPNFSIHGFRYAFSGEGGKTVIPRRVEAKCSVRTVPDQKPEVLASQFKQFIEQKFKDLNSTNRLKFTVLSTGDWWLGDIQTPLYKNAEAAIKQVWGISPVYTREGGSIPIIPFMENLFQAQAIMLPVGQASDSAHSQNERIRIKNLTNGKEVIKLLINS